MRELHEIESQRSAIPPVPASAVKDHLNDGAWALEYGNHLHNTKVSEVGEYKLRF